MQKKGYAIIFARAPCIGAVKSRLAADIGRFRAWRFYREQTARLIRNLQGSSKYHLWLAVTPNKFVFEGRFWPSNIPRIAQGYGDLGRRMKGILHNFPRQPIVIVGSDIPYLRATQVDAAFEALNENDAVLGPSYDGGYWLVGFRQRPAMHGKLSTAIFKDVRWSSTSALSDTADSFPKRWEIAYLETLRDVDRGADLEALGLVS